jgi:hypothetical protein
LGKSLPFRGANPEWRRISFLKLKIAGSQPSVKAWLQSFALHLSKISKMASRSAKSVFDFLCLTGELAENCGRAAPAARSVAKYPFFDTPLSVGYRRRCCIKKRITGNFDLTASVQE